MKYYCNHIGKKYYCNHLGIINKSYFASPLSLTRSPTPLQTESEMLKMVGSPIVHCKIIHKYLHKCRYIIRKYFHDYSLKCCRSRFETKHHDDYYKYTPFDDKRCFFFVVRMHPNLIISAESIEETIYFMAIHCIENYIYER